MKRRLICFSLGLLMLVSLVLSSCSTAKDGETDENAADNSAKTITMWVIPEDETTPKAQELVNEAFPEITKASFKKIVVLKFCTEDEYYEKLEGAIEATQAEEELREQCQKDWRIYQKANKDSGKDIPTLTREFYEAHPEYAKFYNDAQQEEADDDETGEAAVEEETVVNELGITEIKYPDENENQVDIFYMAGYDRYVDYYNREWLLGLDEELNTSSKKLNDYISTSLLSGVQLDGSVYAIPNNVPIGTYNYMMIDKEYFDMYYNKIDGVESVLDIGIFLNDMKNYNADNGLTAEDEGYIVPLDSTFEECLKMLVWYWEMAYTDRSVYVTYYNEDNGREYVLYQQYEKTYEVEIENEETGEITTVDKVEQKIAVLAESDVLYKTDANGNYLDKDGNVLNYSYAVDEDGRFVESEKNGNTIVTFDKTTPGMYLVDENGNPVTKENDKRVIVTCSADLAESEGYELDTTFESEYDDDGYVKASYYYTFNEDCDFSVLGTVMKDPALRSRGSINLGFNALFSDTAYQDLYITMKNYEYEGYFGTPTEGQQSAVFFKEGDARIHLEYEENGVYKDPKTGRDYYVVIAEYPEATNAELFGNMFAVYANSAHPAESMEIITRLNTNAELRNLLQYGIVNQHYELNEDGTVKLLTSNEETYGTYRMDLEKTGNCFIAYPPEELGADAWKYAMVQNTDSLVTPLLGFDFNTANSTGYAIDINLIDHINALNAEAYEKILSCRNKAELENVLIESDGSFSRTYVPSADTVIAKAINSAYDPSTSTETVVVGTSPNTVYFAWLETLGYLAAVNP